MNTARQEAPPLAEPPDYLPDDEKAQYRLLLAMHAALCEVATERPMLAVECTLVAACVLCAAGDAEEKSIIDGAEYAWKEGVVGRRTRFVGPRGNCDTVTVSLDPDEERVALAERLLTLCQQSTMTPLVCGALCLQLAGGWAASSIAMNGKRFVQAVSWAYARSGYWFEVAPAEETACA